MVLLIRLVSGADKTSESQSGVLSWSSFSLSLSISLFLSIDSSLTTSACVVGDNNLAISWASSSDNKADPCLIDYSCDSRCFYNLTS